MTIKEAIKKAIEGGWRDQAVASILFVADCDVSKIKVFINGFGYVQLSTIYKEKKVMESMRHEQVFMNPLFWQSLGKAMGWDEGKIYTFTAPAREQTAVHRGKLSTFQVPEHTITRKAKPRTDQWKREWHKFIDYLIWGGTADDYFKSL